MNEEHRPSEEEALDRAITSMDPMLRASLQREQNQRRMKVAIAGGILMATLAVVLLSVVFLGTGFLGSADAKGPKDEIAKAARAADLTTAGWKLWREQKMAEAEKKFAKAVELDPKLDNAWNGLGWSRFNQGQFATAVEAFEECVQLNPKHPAALNGLGQASFANRKYKDAEKYFLKAEGASAAWYGLMKLYVLQGRFDAAKKYLGKLQTDEQVNKQELELFATAIKNKKLHADLRRMIEPAESPTEDVDSAKLSQQGWQLFFKGQNRAAELAFRKALKADPKNDAANNGLGFALLNQGKTEEAQPLFEALLKKDPKHGGALNGLARCYKANGKVDKAIEVWEKLEEQSKDVTAATSGLAMTYFEQEKYKSAVPYLRRLVKADPKNTEYKKMLKKATSSEATFR